MRKIRSTIRAVPFTTSTQTITATHGTETQREMPKISSDSATPMNSAMVLPRFATSSASRT